MPLAVTPSRGKKQVVAITDADRCGPESWKVDIKGDELPVQSAKQVISLGAGPIFDRVALFITKVEDKGEPAQSAIPPLAIIMRMGYNAVQRTVFQGFFGQTSGGPLVFGDHLGLVCQVSGILSTQIEVFACVADGRSVRCDFGLLIDRAGGPPAILLGEGAMPKSLANLIA